MPSSGGCRRDAGPHSGGRPGPQGPRIIAASVCILAPFDLLCASPLLLPYLPFPYGPAAQGSGWGWLGSRLACPGFRLDFGFLGLGWL